MLHMLLIYLYILIKNTLYATNMLYIIYVIFETFDVFLDV